MELIRLNSFVNVLDRTPVVDHEVRRISCLKKAIEALAESGAESKDVNALIPKYDSERQRYIFEELPENISTGLKTNGGWKANGVTEVHDTIYLALSSPIVNGGSIIDLASRASMAIFPAQCARDIAWNGSPYKECSEFQRLKSLGLDIWMVAPVTMFSPKNWILYDQDVLDPVLPGYLSILNSIMPMLKDLYWQVKHCQTRLDNLERRMSDLEVRVRSIEAQFRYAEMELQIERARRFAHTERTLAIEEPLLLAGKLEDKLILGPCWGPPLPQQLVKSIVGY